MESLPKDDLRFFFATGARAGAIRWEIIVGVDVLESRCAVSTVHVRIASAVFFIDDGAVQVREM